LWREPIGTHYSGGLEAAKAEEARHEHDRMDILTAERSMRRQEVAVQQPSKSARYGARVLALPILDPEGMSTAIGHTIASSPTMVGCVPPSRYNRRRLG
jgi:hypothetical protein